MNTPKLSPKLSPDEMHQVLTDWHEHYCDDPLYDHIQTSFEDMADQLWVAMKDLRAAQDEQSSRLLEDTYFVDTYAQLDALSIFRVVA